MIFLVDGIYGRVGFSAIGFTSSGKLLQRENGPRGGSTRLRPGWCRRRLLAELKSMPPGKHGGDHSHPTPWGELYVDATMPQHRSGFSRNRRGGIAAGSCSDRLLFGSEYPQLSAWRSGQRQLRRCWCKDLVTQCCHARPRTGSRRLDALLNLSSTSGARSGHVRRRAMQRARTPIGLVMRFP